jgi:2-dehydro-3-deoxy-L-rhamnonate dehydrogenase (NAD+)
MSEGNSIVVNRNRRHRPFEGRLALVTGGAGGIGRGIAVELLKAGARVVIGDIADRAMAETVRDLAPLGPIHSVRLDVSSHELIREGIDEVTRDHGPIEILVNNAGIAGPGFFAEEDPRRISKELAIDLVAPICLTHHVLPQMLRAGWGRIANISSMMAFTGAPGFAVYSAAKSGVHAFSTAIERETRRTHGVHVTSVLPPSVKTQSFADAKRAQATMMRWSLVPPVSVEQVARRTVRGLIHGHRRVYCGPQSYLASLLQRLFPWLMDWVMMFMFRGGKQPQLPSSGSAAPASHA